MGPHFWFLCPNVPCTLPRGPAYSASVHKETRVRPGAMRWPCPATPLGPGESSGEATVHLPRAVSWSSDPPPSTPGS